MPLDTPTPSPTPRPHPELVRYAFDRRAEAVAAMDRLAHVRRRGPVPFERQLREMERENLRAAQRWSGKVLP